MDNSLLVGLSAQRVLRRRLDITANNLANLNTTAFKSEELLQREAAEKPATEGSRERAISYAHGWATVHDMSAGPLRRTGSPLDLAIDGEGFFHVEAEDGQRFYTRDGRLRLDAEGRLVLRSGAGEPLTVLDEGGAPITVDIDVGDITVGPEGEISQQGAAIGRIGVVLPADTQTLRKAEGGLWESDGSEIADDGSRVAQGFLEDSNVQAIGELTELIRITRTYEGVARMLSQIGQLRSSAIDALAEVN